MKLRALSLFSGCGGLDLGFHQNNVDIVAAVDNDAAAIKCYSYNFNGGGIVLNVESKEFKRFINSQDNIDIVLGGFPCQGFSKSGPKIKEDPRNKLYESMVYAIQVLHPKVFIAENVDGLAQNYRGEFLGKILHDFTSLGYKVEYKIIDAADFGVPQHRRRIIFMGTLSFLQIAWPNPTHLAKVRNGEFLSKDLLKPDFGIFAPALPAAITMRKAIGDLVRNERKISDHVTISNIRPDDLKIIKHIKEGQKLCNVRFSPTSVYTWQIQEVFGEVSKKEVVILETIAKNRRRKIYGPIPNGNPLKVDEISKLSHLQITQNDLDVLEKKEYVKKIEEKYDIKGAMFCSGLYKRPRWDDPSPTIITLFYSPRYLVHPSEDRPLTIRECARLQSFPDNFKFLASKITIEDSYRLIGNAVAPRLAYQIAKATIEHITAKKIYETTAPVIE